MRPQVTSERVALTAAFLASVAYGLVIWSAGQSAGLWAPLGSDGVIWQSTAELVASGGRPGQPPLFPALTVVLGLGHPTPQAAMALNALCVALSLMLSSGLAWLALPRGHARSLAVILAPLAVALAADPAGYAWFVHPEALTTAALLGTGVAAAALWRSPSWLTAGALGAACAVAVASKEHGLVPAALAPIWLGLLSQGTWRQRARLLAVGGGVFLVLAGPWLFGGQLLSKALVSVGESADWMGGGAAEVLPVEMSEGQIEAMAEGRTLSTFALQVFSASRDWWPVYAGALATLGGLVVTRRWRLALALVLPLSPLAPAFLVWTEPRHYLVMATSAASLAVLGPALVAHRFSRAGALALAALGLLACGLTASPASARLSSTLAEAARHQDQHQDAYRALAWLHANARPSVDLLQFEGDPVVLGKSSFLPPRPDTRSPEPGVDLYAVARSSPGAGWELLQTFGQLSV